MSCEVKCVSKVVELERIRKLFGLSSGEPCFCDKCILYVNKGEFLDNFFQRMTG